MMSEIISNWEWQRPYWLLGIPLVILLASLLIKQHYARNVWEKYVDRHLLSHLANISDDQDHWLNVRRINGIIIIGLLISLAALAGPAWERQKQAAIDNETRLIVIADMTFSMLATDLKPSRLVRQKFKIREFLKSHDQGQMALIAFSGDAYIVSPFTEDYRTIDYLASSLSPENMPALGSNPQSAFLLARQLIASDKRKALIVMFTDEILPGSAQAIESLMNSGDWSKNGIPIPDVVFVGVGTEAGSPIKLPSGRFIVDDKNSIVSAHLDREALQNLASRIDAHYVDLSDDDRDVNKLLTISSYKPELLSLSQETPDSASEQDLQQWNDRGGWLALLVIPAFLCVFRKGYVLNTLLLALSLSLFSLPGELKANTEIATEAAAAAGADLERTWWNKLWSTPDQTGMKHYREDNYEAARQAFIDTGWRALATSKAGDYDTAILELQRLNSVDELSPEQQSNTLYNLAYSQAYAGEIEEALFSLESALKIRPGMKQAIEAKKILRELLAEQNAKDDGNNHQEQQGDKNGSGKSNPNSEAGENGQGQQDSSKYGSETDDQDSSKYGSETDDQDNSNSGNEDSRSNDQESKFAQDPSNQQTAQQSGDSTSGESSNKELNSDESQENVGRQWPDHDHEIDDSKFRDAEDLSFQDDESLEQQALSNELTGDNESENQFAEQSQGQERETKPVDIDESSRLSLDDSDSQAENSEQESMTVIQQTQLEEWLNQVNDDPSGLLKRKFEYERQVRQRDGNMIIENEQSQLW